MDARRSWGRYSDPNGVQEMAAGKGNDGKSFRYKQAVAVILLGTIAVSMGAALGPDGGIGKNLLSSCSFLCCVRGCGTEDKETGISQHLPNAPPVPRRIIPFRLFRKRKHSNTGYMKRVANKALTTYGPVLDNMYQEFRRNMHKKRDRSWEQTVSRESESLAFESYRRQCPYDWQSLEYDQRTVYENAKVNDLDKFYKDDTYRADKDGSTETLEILAEDKNTQTVVLYQLVRYPWPLINREYIYIRRRFEEGDKCYYIMKAVKGREVLPNEKPDESWTAPAFCAPACAPRRSQRVEDFDCLICFSSCKNRDGTPGACEWRQVGKEDFGIRNTLLTRAAKVAAAKSLWPFQQRLEDTFRAYSSKSYPSRRKGKKQSPALQITAGLLGWALGVWHHRRLGKGALKESNEC